MGMPVTQPFGIGTAGSGPQLIAIQQTGIASECAKIDGINHSLEITAFRRRPIYEKSLKYSLVVKHNHDPAIDSLRCAESIEFLIETRKWISLSNKTIEYFSVFLFFKN